MNKTAIAILGAASRQSHSLGARKLRPPPIPQPGRSRRAPSRNCWTRSPMPLPCSRRTMHRLRPVRASRLLAQVRSHAGRRLCGADRTRPTTMSAALIRDLNSVPFVTLHSRRGASSIAGTPPKPDLHGNHDPVLSEPPSAGRTPGQKSAPGRCRTKALRCPPRGFASAASAPRRFQSGPRARRHASLSPSVR